MMSVFMAGCIVFLVAWVAFVVVDTELYIRAVKRYGPHRMFWMGSGFYLTWRYWRVRGRE